MGDKGIFDILHSHKFANVFVTYLKIVPNPTWSEIKSFSFKEVKTASYTFQMTW